MLTGFIPARQRRLDAIWARVDKLTGVSCGWSIYVPKAGPSDCDF